MRVLHVIWSIDPSKGGPPSALVKMAKAQSAMGMDVFIVATWAEDENLSVTEEMQSQGVKIKLIGPCVGPLGWHRKISSVMRIVVHEADVVHIHGLWEEINYQAVCAANQFSVPYIIRPCGMLDPWSLAQSRARKQLYMVWRLRKMLDGAAAIHFTSQTESDLTAPLHIKAPMIVEPNGVDLEEFEILPTYGEFRTQYPVLEKKIILLFMSRLHPKKGLDLLIPAFALIRVADVVLVLAGPCDAHYGIQLEQLAKKHGIEHQVIFTGMLRGRDRVAALADADLFVLPSYQENFGLVVAESLAAGTPVVISDQVNIHDQISAAQVGGVVPLDVCALGEELTRWLTDNELRHTAGTRARPFVWEHYDWQKIVSRWKEHYNRLVSGLPTCSR